MGSDRHIRQLAGQDTEQVNPNGKLLLPGFIDTHIHFHEWSLQRWRSQLHNVSSQEELLGRVRREVTENEPGRWITGQGWNEIDWKHTRMPDRDILDQVASDHSVLLWRCDMHLAVANSAALGRAGLTTDTCDPPQGRIERDANGRPIGVLRALAINLIRDVVDLPAPDELTIAYEEAMECLHRMGVTSIHDIRLMNDREGNKALQTFWELENSGRLDLRCWVMFPGNYLSEIIGLGLRTGFGNEKLRLGTCKIFCRWWSGCPNGLDD